MKLLDLVLCQIKEAFADKIMRNGDLIFGIGERGKVSKQVQVN